MRGRRANVFCFCVVALCLLASGCATSKGSYSMTSPPKDEACLARYTNVVVELDSARDISLTSSDRERIVSRIVKHIPTECPKRFDAVNPSQAGPSTMHALVYINRYDEGNAFARAMLAGLGQMHIDATVTLSDMETKEQIVKYDVSKTFAWGGMYGGITRITDIEDGFARAVAASMSGKKESREGT